MTGVATRPLLLGGNHHWGRPVLEKGTPVNEGNQPLRDNGEAVANGHCLTLWNSLSPGRQPGDFFVLGNRAPEARYSNGIFRPDGAGSESDMGPRADARG